jgi:hypothetical protein
VSLKLPEIAVLIIGEILIALLAYIFAAYSIPLLKAAPGYTT